MFAPLLPAVAPQSTCRDQLLLLGTDLEVPVMTLGSTAFLSSFFPFYFKSLYLISFLSFYEHAKKLCSLAGVRPKTPKHRQASCVTLWQALRKLTWKYRPEVLTNASSRVLLFSPRTGACVSSACFSLLELDWGCCPALDTEFFSVRT